MATNIFTAQEYKEVILARGAQAMPVLPSELNALVEQMATQSHEAQCKGKRAAGYTYGEVTSDEAKTHQLLVPFEELSEVDKQEARRNVRTSIHLILGAGCTISKNGTPATEEQLQEKILEIVEALHDEWSLAKFQKGYSYAKTRNDNPENGPLTHRDLLPFNLLMQLHPEDADYDRQTAEAAVKAVQDAGFIISI